MRKSVTDTVIYCDCCQEVIHTPSIVVNNKPPSTFTYADIDLCALCTIEILRRLVGDGLSIEKLKEKIADTSELRQHGFSSSFGRALGI